MQVSNRQHFLSDAEYTVSEHCRHLTEGIQRDYNSNPKLQPLMQYNHSMQSTDNIQV